MLKSVNSLFSQCNREIITQVYRIKSKRNEQEKVLNSNYFWFAVNLLEKTKPNKNNEDSNTKL